MTTKHTKKTETTDAKEPLFSSSFAEISIESQSLRTEQLDDIIESVRGINTNLTLTRYALEEYRVKPWHLLVAVWLGAVAAVAGAQAVAIYEDKRKAA